MITANRVLLAILALPPLLSWYANDMTTMKYIAAIYFIGFVAYVAYRSGYDAGRPDIIDVLKRDSEIIKAAKRQERERIETSDIQWPN